MKEEAFHNLLRTSLLELTNQFLSTEKGSASSEWKVSLYEEGPITRSVQLPHIPVAAFSQTDLV